LLEIKLQKLLSISDLWGKERTVQDMGLEEVGDARGVVLMRSCSS